MNNFLNNNLHKSLFLGLVLLSGNIFAQEAKMKFASATQTSDFQSGIARVESKDKVGFVDKKGREVVAAKYENAYDMSEGLAAVEKNGKWGFVDKAGKEKIAFVYDEALNFSQSMAAVRLGEKWGFVDKKEN